MFFPIKTIIILHASSKNSNITSLHGVACTKERLPNSVNQITDLVVILEYFIKLYVIYKTSTSEILFLKQLTGFVVLNKKLISIQSMSSF